MKTPKSLSLRNLMSNIQLAQFSNENPEIPVDKIVAFKNADNLGRRKFIGDITKFSLLTGAIGGSILLSCKNDNKTPIKQIKTNKKIAIIGGGMAGLNAAYQLSKHGIKATVYEGSNRLGGRILTHYGDALQMGIHPEFGGDFVDTVHLDMIQLAKEFDLELVNMRADSQKNNLEYETYFFENRPITEAEIIEEFKKITPKLAKDKASLGENYDTPEALYFDKLSLADYIKSFKCKQWLKDIFDVAYLAEFGLENNEQSSINLLDMIDTDTKDGFKIWGDSDENFRIKGGNSKLIKSLSEKVKDSIILNSILIGITNKEEKYKLSFQDKDDVEADIVILCLPFNMLKNVKIDLKEMTPEKMNSIKNLGFGQNNKLFLGYENRPWREGKNKSKGNTFHKNIHTGLDASDVKSVESNKGVFCALFGGNESIRLANIATQHPHAPKWHVWKTNLPDEEINKIVDDLDDIFPDSKKTYANKHVFACWSSYPFTKGSYTCPKVGQWNNEMLHIAAPIGNIYFAGEHCSVDFQGYMNGAAETGRKAAENIVDNLLKNKA